jgi:hypothetical protein
MRHAANTIEKMHKRLLGYRDNMRVEVETGIAVTAKTVADLRALPAWPDGLALNIHVDLDPRFSVMRVAGSIPGESINDEPSTGVAREMPHRHWSAD